MRREDVLEADGGSVNHVGRCCSCVGGFCYVSDVRRCCGLDSGM